ncbi:uncharacterized protein OCT59_006257 [Rhizophagus irregularis]|uniref:uncharacterized protein n=1 Tax=Rhizophagus irregularis TaxID=588596 RepID=UPI0033201B7F|nr:hypothetical protein OCT59_006257 [Rhizophagus irregularis]
MPFILNSFLESSSLKENESRSILRRIQESRINMVKNVIIACWVYVAKTMRIVFESKFTLDSYDELQKCLEEEMKILPKVFPEFANLPNLHIEYPLAGACKDLWYSYKHSSWYRKRWCIGSLKQWYHEQIARMSS